jgi:NitT/TauT family transport system ATP-binding protein
MRVEHLAKTFQAAAGAVTVFRDLSLEIPEGEITVILGPSGCGKTTLLHVLAGMLMPDGGRVSGAPEGVRYRKPGSLSFIFQEPRLLSWMNVARNIDLVLQGIIPDRGERESRTAHVLSMVGLEGASGLFPEELSGGMRQRAAIARAFAYPSRLILMDEPFQSLDLKFRIDLIGEYLKLWEEDRRTTVMVTHDVREALLMADTIYLLTEKPAEVGGVFRVETKRGLRSLTDGEVSRLEQAIYRAMGIG